MASMKFVYDLMHLASETSLPWGDFSVRYIGRERSTVMLYGILNRVNLFAFRLPNILIVLCVHVHTNTLSDLCQFVVFRALPLMICMQQWVRVFYIPGERVQINSPTFTCKLYTQNAIILILPPHTHTHMDVWFMFSRLAVFVVLLWKGRRKWGVDRNKSPSHLFLMSISGL